jgi:hypothetical protein
MRQQVERVFDAASAFDRPRIDREPKVFGQLTACRSVRSSDRNPFDFEPIAALEAGVVLHFNCHVDTTEERAAELGVDAPPTTQRFGNQAFDAEMCLLHGHTTGARLGFGF